MTCKTERRHQETPVVGTSTKPAPLPTERQPESRLFQSLDELGAEHGTRSGAKQAAYIVGGGLLFGGAVFALLYLGILFLE